MSTYKISSFMVDVLLSYKQHSAYIIALHRIVQLNDFIIVLIFIAKGPVFSGAFKNGGLLRLYSDEVIKFTAVDINRGDGYDPNTGVFTVPRPGVYIISSTLRSYNGIRFHCYLWKNNEKLAFLYGSNMNTGTVHIVRKLKKGDQLYIKHMYRRGENEAIQKGRTSMFSVAFLSDD